MQALLTGSQVYGTPHADSDIDLVLRVSVLELNLLINTKGADLIHIYPDNDSASLKFGKLNLICVTSDKMYDVWVNGTAHLVEQKPVTRSEAIQHFASLGVTPRLDSQGERPKKAERTVDEFVNDTEHPF